MESSLPGLSTIEKNGSKPEEWLAFINRSKRQTANYSHILNLYGKAASLISPDENRKNISYARLLVEFAKLQGMTSPDDARDTFRVARCNVKKFAIVHVAWAQFELSQGNRDKCQSLLKKGILSGAEPIDILIQARYSCEQGNGRLLDDETEELALTGVLLHAEPGKPRAKPIIPTLQSDSEMTQEKLVTGDNTTKNQEQLMSLNGSQHGESLAPSYKQENSGVISFKLSEDVERSHPRIRQKLSSSSSSGEDTVTAPLHHICRPSISMSTCKPSSKATPDCKSVDSSSLSNSMNLSVRKSSARRGLRNHSLFLGPPIRGSCKPSLEDVQEKKIEGEDQQEVDDLDDIKALDHTSQLLMEAKAPCKNVESPSESKENDPCISDISVQTTTDSDNLKNKENVDISSFENEGNQDVIHHVVNKEYSRNDQSIEKVNQTNPCPSVIEQQGNLLHSRKDIQRFSNEAVWPNQEYPKHPMHEGKGYTNQKMHNHQGYPNQEMPLQRNQGYHYQEMPNNMGGPSKVADDIKDFGKRNASSKQNFPPAPTGIGNTNIFVNGKQYLKLGTIGRGGSSKVFRAYDGQRVCAVKYVSLEDADDVIIQSYINEITMLKRLQGSDYIIRLYDWEQKKYENSIVLVLECGSIDLAAFLRKHRSTFTQTELTAYWKQMLEAVNVIHDQGIIHSDLKPANFLFVEGRLKLIDFGIANAIQADQTSIQRDTQVGTLNFMSPEAFQDISGSSQIYPITERSRPCTKIGRPSDVWSLGCILYNMVYGRTPFQHITNQAMKLQCIMDENYSIEFPPVDNQQLLDVLKGCLIRNPRERYTIPQLLKHPFLSSGIQEPSEEQLYNCLMELARAHVNSPRSIRVASKSICKQLRSGNKIDLSSVLAKKQQQQQSMALRKPLEDLDILELPQPHSSIKTSSTSSSGHGVLYSNKITMDLTAE